MFYFLKILPLLINIDQETVLSWFGVEDPQVRDIQQASINGYEFNLSTIEPSTDVSLDTFRLVVEGLWNKIQDGLTLADIENVLFFILFVRFIILVIRYNLKTSFYITCIGIFAGYLWYRHLIDLISMYRSVLLKLPFLNKLGMDAVQLRSMHRQTTLTDLKLGENIHWYNPGQMIYYAFTKGMINVDSETGLRYYIDPISMVISKVQEPAQSNIVSIYYKLYNKIIPKIYDICSKFWSQLSGVAAYAVITRIGKRYCPYLVRWHWTFLLIIGMIEQIFIYFIYRVYYFQTFVLIPQTKTYVNYVDPNLILQVNILNGVIACIVLTHIGFILFGLFHAIWGQYFYVPFFVENTELHIGPRPKNSIYSGGNTAWQNSEEKEKNLNRVFPKLWYGWFGNGTRNSWNIGNKLSIMIINIFKKLQRPFQD
uniref:hypothetical chloroplast RF90 n=1 Tax=Haslea karadagensis TaxID=1146996 RepID=UPI00220E3458|nr:hypothetical chloroplast RF90 [Haslea karadagensis]UXN44829.1 hypothetical chloroplast RF90 [Haslea karadagensis]UXN45091.1 hypothetical chloroplast RF90 [Haslea karadagensis]